MTADLKKEAAGQSLTDYREHYRADAEAIVDPGELDSLRHASEHRRFEALVRLLQLQPGERVLDIGCGSGWLADRCQAAGARVLAMDIAPAGVRAARGRFPAIADFLAGDGYHLPYADASFDVVVLSEVVEHLEEVETALTEVRRVLKPGGRVLVSVPYKERILHHLCIHCNQMTPANAHLHSFDESKLQGHLRNSGLGVDRQVLLTNKLLELAGFPRWSRRWPYWCWRSVDRLFNRIVPRPGFLCVLAVRTD
jgi:SAM-dependent methyltransferase